MTYWLPPVLGLALLFMGWRLFWLFVGVAGFAAGLQAAPLLFGMQPFAILWGVGLFAVSSVRCWRFFFRNWPLF
jgi:hypothetical protein